MSESTSRGSRSTYAFQCASRGADPAARQHWCMIPSASSVVFDASRGKSCVDSITPPKSLEGARRPSGRTDVSPAADSARPSLPSGPLCAVTADVVRTRGDSDVGSAPPSGSPPAPRGFALSASAASTRSPNRFSSRFGAARGRENITSPSSNARVLIPPMPIPRTRTNCALSVKSTPC